MPSTVHIIRTGSANLASVAAAIERAQLEPIVTDDPIQVGQAALCILPGVGAFKSAMNFLQKRNLDRAIIDRITRGRPLLAICLGLQLLLEGSEESPDEAGLGVVPGIARRFDSNQIVPHIGWNEVVPCEGFEAATTGWAYFANSFRLVDPPPGWSVATTDYGGPFVSAMQKSPSIIACQFHPELSSDWGAELIRRWIKASVQTKQEVQT